MKRTARSSALPLFLPAAESSRLFAGGVAVSFENRYRCKDGSYRWLSWKAAGQAERGLIPPASFSPTSYGGARVILAQASTCGVLHLELGAVNLNLLGVVVTTMPVTIDVNGDTAGPLGNLVCAILATLNNVVGLVNLLNSLLGLVTGLLGGLTGGLGGAVAM